MNAKLGALTLVLGATVWALVAGAAPTGATDPHGVVGPTGSAAPAASGATAGAPAPAASASASAGTGNPPADAGVATADGGAGAQITDSCNMGTPDAPETLTDAWAALASEVCASKCTGETLCLRADTGGLLCESAPSELGAGSQLTVRVFGPAGCTDEIELSSATRKRLDTLFEREPSVAPEQSGRSEPELVELKSSQITVSSDLSVVAVQITFTRSADPNPITSTHELAVMHGYYYVALGALLPIVPDGKRVAVAQPGATDGEPRLVIDPDLYITPGLSLNVFPFGGKSRGQVFCCRSDRWFQELVGLQFGVGLDFSEPPALFAGILLEPIAGVGFSGGLSLLQNDVLNDDAVEGMLLRDPASLPVHRTYRPHFYVALTLSLDVVDTVLAAKNKLAGTNLQ